MDKHKPLTIYKASAGSGKTFQLAVDFISLLVLNPDSYKDILAVTFTNKATDENENENSFSTKRLSK